jgi:hypothetical protein
VHGELQIREYFADFSEVVIRSAGGGEFDGKSDDHHRSVPFSCRLEDATGGNRQQLPATRSNSTGTPLLTGGLLVRIQPEEPFP